jgi:hypothetical protein
MSSDPPHDDTESTGNGHTPEETTDPKLSRWDITALEELVEAIAARQAVDSSMLRELDVRVLALRDVVESRINAQLAGHAELSTKLDIILKKLV